MSYQHLTTFERSRIELLQQQGYSARQIGKSIGRYHSTISRELNRNTEDMYCAENTQQKYVTRRAKSKPYGKYSAELGNVIKSALNNTWSPEQISNTLTQGKICFKTIYRWLYQGLLSRGNLAVLRHKGKRHKPKETRERFNIGTSISKRPKDVKKRTTFGHWELDTIVSSRGKAKNALLLLLNAKQECILQ